MRRLLLAALAFAAIPALAQDDSDREVEREVIIEIDTLDVPDLSDVRRIEVERDGDERRVIIRRRGDANGEIEEEVIRLGMPGPDDRSLRLFMPDGERAFRFQVPEFDGDGPFALFHSDGPGAALSVLRGGVSPETRARIRTLQREARDLAREARSAEGADRGDAIARLDAVLADLFEARGQARQEEADHLRERAREMMDEADAKEQALRARAADRQALIEARRAELLGEPSSDW